MVNAEERLAPVLLTVLLIDGGAESTQRFKDDLTHLGYTPEVVQIHSREDLTNWLTTLNHTADVVVANHRVADFEAKDVLEIIKGLKLDVPVVLLSDPSQDAEKGPLFRLGAFTSIAKNEVHRLVPIIEERMRNRKEFKELKDKLAKDAQTQAVTVSDLEKLRIEPMPEKKE